MLYHLLGCIVLCDMCSSLGRQGETIKALQNASEAHIVVNQDFPEGVDRQITVSGRQDAVDRAARMIRELIAGEPGSAQNIIQKV